MRVADLPIPNLLRTRYEESGIHELYPPQVECVEKGIFRGKNLLVAIPTASGKTLIAEMAMHHHIERGGKCLYIVPLKALASEKYGEFSEKGVFVGISTGDFDRRDDYLGRNDIIVATSEKVDSLLRNNASWLADISLLILDEVHLIDSPDRGPTLEMVLTKMRSRNPGLQVIALSATIGNPGTLARWLNAEPITSSWRPVDLMEGVFFNGEIHFHEKTRPVQAISRYEDLNLLADTIEEGGQCLVFVSSRKNAEAFAKRAAKALSSENASLDEYARRLTRLAETDSDRILSACVEKGAAFHHAGLRRAQREIIEEGFRKGDIRCISSTPTLAAGLNLPARRVIIRDYRRYASGQGMVPIPAREYHQMAGRAGRPHLDPYGEAVLIAKNEEDVDALYEFYIDAPAEDVNSQIASESALTTHVLSLIASNFVHSREELSRFLENTYYHHQRKSTRIFESITGKALQFLESSEMVVEMDNHLSVTEYGQVVSQLYIDPRSADAIVTNLLRIDRFSEIGLLQLICSTPDMYTLYVANRDLHYLTRFVCEHDHELWVKLPFGEDEDYYRALKTAMLLHDWSLEVPESLICERYSVGPGDIHNLLESSGWLLHAAGRLAGMFVPRFVKHVREYEICLKHGIKRELLPLVSLRNVGRVRARRLFNNGLVTPEAVRKAGIERVAPILGRGVAAQIFSQIAKGRHNGDEAETGSYGQHTLLHFQEEREENDQK